MVAIDDESMINGGQRCLPEGEVSRLFIPHCRAVNSNWVPAL